MYVIDCCRQRHQPKEMRQSTVYCKVCNKAYVSEKNLQDHMNKHRGIKPYECSQCDAKFGIKTMWQRHMKNHERGLIKCPIPGCNRQAENEAALNKHMVNIEGKWGWFRVVERKICGNRMAINGEHIPPLVEYASLDSFGENGPYLSTFSYMQVKLLQLGIDVTLSSA